MLKPLFTPTCSFVQIKFEASFEGSHGREAVLLPLVRLQDGRSQQSQATQDEAFGWVWDWSRELSWAGLRFCSYSFNFLGRLQHREIEWHSMVYLMKSYQPFRKRQQFLRHKKLVNIFTKHLWHVSPSWLWQSNSHTLVEDNPTPNANHSFLFLFRPLQQHCFISQDHCQRNCQLFDDSSY